VPLSYNPAALPALLKVDFLSLQSAACPIRDEDLNFKIEDESVSCLLRAIALLRGMTDEYGAMTEC
jgi:hypothetical protein